jgi:GT2 family glycosyltransferase
MNKYTQGVTIIVPTLNRGRYLLDTLQDLLAQEHRPLEVLVVDQSTAQSSELRELVNRHPDLMSYYKVKFHGLPLARNYGWQNAKYEAIVFVDDDIRCGPSLVTEHLRGLIQPNTGVVAGGIDETTPQDRSTRPGQFNSWTATPVRSFGASRECLARHAAGCNFSVWRSVLQTAGGFDETFAMGAALYEETEFCLRVQECGFDIYFNGRARLQHLAAANGGCRVFDIPNYVRSLAHNRAILIRRHLRWSEAPTAWFRLLLLLVSYTAHYHNLNIFRLGIAGLCDGAQAAKQPPVCTQYKLPVLA